MVDSADESTPPSVFTGQDLAPGTRLGDYLILAKLGAGGTATVYSATHPAIGSRVAIKVMHLGFVRHGEVGERILQEARCANQIGHPNIVDIFSWGVLPDGRRYFVMEWLDGESLSHHIDHGTLDWADKLDALAQLTDAVEAAHNQGVIHRDIKSDNIMLIRLGMRYLVKLVDFGLALLTGPGVKLGRLTQRLTTLGTPQYLSPEQARGKDVDHRTDIYAIGVVAFELMLGRLPFNADNSADVIRMHLNVAPPSPLHLWPEIPRSLADILTGMLEKRPEDRPTLGEVRRVLCGLARAPSPPPVRREEAPLAVLPSEQRVTVRQTGLLAVGTDPDAVAPVSPDYQFGTGWRAGSAASADFADDPEIEVVLEMEAQLPPEALHAAPPPRYLASPRVEVSGVIRLLPRRAVSSAIIDAELVESPPAPATPFEASIIPLESRRPPAVRLRRRWFARVATLALVVLWGLLATPEPLPGPSPRALVTPHKNVR